ncbi:platelet-activating factor acetylhydrolase, isoform II-domain-containing protein [Staphylotrichum tortipilum]|uniref:Putative phospholipase n=1 Tax=Staphylotrichum tortipilum TaxID=2831512 RepID=A0AAN6MDZ8_9PEZI|nr:platelet-activating factor acetylhydrolase, isoform II-domain-containing protein [Staphylotrichum longicolle]
MASFASSLSPVPAFPDYTGPFKVGTIDVEIAVSDLVSPSPAPDGAADIHTVLFRIFYPAVPQSQRQRVPWLPTPQRLHVAAYAQFLGAGSTLASVLSFFPRHLHWTSIPAYKNAALLPVPSDRPTSRWPTMIFSHGLGGNRNAYSHLAGSLASYGVVVVCPEHRDGSAALSLVRDPKNPHERDARKLVPCIRIPIARTPATWAARDKQLRIRLWELGLVYEALSAIDRGHAPTLQANLNTSTPAPALSQFTNALDILEPGHLIFSGHSFGAASVVQLLKSTFYANHPSVSAMPNPLFTPSNPASSLTKQITPATPTILLDMWCFPLLSANSTPLYNLPLPCYATPHTRTRPPALLAIESAAFVAWSDNLHAKARILSPAPASITDAIAETVFTEGEEKKVEKPHFFYVASSAHINQSDFGVLFPWLTKKVFKAERPERVLRLNVRGQLQFLRERGVRVEGTRAVDLVDGGHPEVIKGLKGRGKRPVEEETGVEDDGVVLTRGKKGGVEAWEWIDLVGLGGKAAVREVEMEAKGEGKVVVEKEVVEEGVEVTLEAAEGGVEGK